MFAEQGSVAADSAVPAGGERRCPACGEPLYGWAVLEPDNETRTARRVLDRCESCGLGLVRDVHGVDLSPDAADLITVPNRRSWQAGIGGGHWAALELEPRDAYLTPQAIGLLLDRARLEPLRLRQPVFAANQLWMWQTLLNGFTFHDGFAVRVLRRQLGLRNARSAAAFFIDAIVTTLAALPMALIALPLELAAVALRRGGLIEVEVSRPRA